MVTKAPVKAVFPAPDGEHAIAFLGQLAGSSMPGGYAVVPLTERLPPKIVPTKAPPLGIAIAPSPSRSALVTVSAGTEGHAVHVIRMPALANDAITLPSAPLAAGIVAETGKGFVAQRHPEGRITFVDLGTGSPRTVTRLRARGQGGLWVELSSRCAVLRPVAVALGLVACGSDASPLSGSGYDGSGGSSNSGSGAATGTGGARPALP